MFINDYKTIIVISQPSCGVNHFSNLLATSPLIENRINTTDYYQHLQNGYSSVTDNAHFGSDLFNLQGYGNGIGDPRVINLLEQTKNPYILCGHLPGLEGNAEYIRQLGPALVMLFDISSKSLLTAGVPKTVAEHLSNNYHLTQIRSSINTLLLTNDIISIDIAQLLTDDISELLSSLNTQFNLDIDIVACQKLHSQWFNNVWLKRFY